MTTRLGGSPILAALADAVHDANPDQVPMCASALFSRARARLHCGAQVTDSELADAAATLAAVGVLSRHLGGWSAGPLPRRAVDLTGELNRAWWSGRRQRRREGLV